MFHMFEKKLLMCSVFHLQVSVIKFSFLLFLYSSASQHVIPEPAEPALWGTCLKCKLPGFHSETLGVRLRNPGFKISLVILIFLKV